MKRLTFFLGILFALAGGIAHSYLYTPPSSTAIPSGAAGGSLSGTYPNPTFNEFLAVALGDQTTAITADGSTPKLTIPYWPQAVTLTDAQIQVSTAQTGGNDVRMDIKKNGTTIFSTKPMIDDSELSSATGTGEAFSSSTFAVGDKIEFFIDQVGDGTAKGPMAVLVFHK